MKAGWKETFPYTSLSILVTSCHDSTRATECGRASFELNHWVSLGDLILVMVQQKLQQKASCPNMFLLSLTLLSFPVMLEHSVIFRTVSNLTWYFLHWKSCLKRIVACHCEIKPICTFGISAFISCYRTAVKQRSLGFCCHQIVLPLFKVLTVCWNLTLQNMTKWFCTVFQLQVNILGLVGICDFAKSHPLKLTVITYGLRHWWYDPCL